jgi:hypothetical protein
MRAAQAQLDGKLISYRRVSTDKQDERGYGLDAQRKAITEYLNGGSWELLGEYVEVESGKHNHRPKLAVLVCEVRSPRHAAIERRGRFLRRPFRGEPTPTVGVGSVSAAATMNCSNPLAQR